MSIAEANWLTTTFYYIEIGILWDGDHENKAKYKKRGRK